MEIDVHLGRKYMSEDPIIDPETGYSLNYPIGLQVGRGPERDEVVKKFAKKRELAGIVVPDDLLQDIEDPDAGRSWFDLMEEEDDDT